LGHNAACTSEYWATTLNTSNGFEFSAHSRLLTDPKLALGSSSPSLPPPVCTRRSPTVGLILRWLAAMVPSGEICKALFHIVPVVLGSFSQMPITTQAPALLAAAQSRSVSGPPTTTEFRNSSAAISRPVALVAA